MTKITPKKIAAAVFDVVPAIARRKTKYIRCAGPSFAGAPYPRFDRLAINEKRFERECRFKEYRAEISPSGECSLYWLAQDEPRPTAKFDAEVRRAFKANGAKDGDVVRVAYECRDEPGRIEYELTI